MRKFFFFALFALTFSGFSQTALKTPWAEKMNPSTPLSEYPRPQLVRSAWQNLNGRWDFAILPKGSSPESGFAGKITVPFAVESLLSGVQTTVGPENELWYERTFELALD